MIDFDTRTSQLDDLLGVGRNFDMVGRVLRVGGRQAKLWVVNGYAQEGVLERIIAQWLAAPDLTDMKTPDAFLQRFVTACDAAVCLKKEAAVLGVFSGKTLLEMTAKGANKRGMVQRLAALLDIPQDRVICVGDHANDVSMLTWAGAAFAPANALPEVLALPCVHALPDCRENAIAALIALLDEKY